MLDVFKGNTFNTMALTTSINKLPFAPSRIGQMGLFTPQPVAKTVVLVEEYNGVLTLVPTSARGGPATLGSAGKRTCRNFAIPHLAVEDVILADDLQDIRAFGSEDTVAGMAQVVNQRLLEHRQRMEVTQEYHKIGALHGIILDADGATTIYNLFTEFGVSEDTVDFDFATATSPIREKCLQVKRYIETALGGLVYDHIHAFCGYDFFEDLISHATVAAAYNEYMGAIMRRNDPRSGFEYGGIIFEEYPGSVGGVSFIDHEACRFFPVGTPNLFKVHYAPADFVEAVNTLGLPVYAKQEPMEFGRGIKLHVQSNPLALCHIPKVLVAGTIT